MGLQRVRHDWLRHTYLILSSTCLITLHLFHISFMAIYIYTIFYHFQKLFDPHILKIRKWLLPPLYSWRNWVSERWNDADPVTWQWSRSVFVLSIHLLSTVLFVYLYFGKLLSWGLNGVLVLKVITDLIWTSSILYISHMANQIIAPVASMQTISRA